MGMRLAALAATFATGCSLFSGSTPTTRPSPPLTCRTDRTSPVIDAVLGTAALGGGAALIYDDMHSRSEFSGLATVYLGLPLLGVGALYGLASTYGFVQTSRCRRFHRELGIPIATAPMK